MFDEDLEDDELDTEDGDEIELDEVDDVDMEVDEEVELDTAVEDDADDDFPAAKKSAAKSKTAEPEAPSLEAKNRERDELARAMEEFLARGGKIQEVSARD